MQQRSGRNRLAPKKVGGAKVGSKRNRSTQNTHTHTKKENFLISLAGIIVPGGEPHPSQWTTRTRWRIVCAISNYRKRPVSPRDDLNFVPGPGPFCPTNGSGLSRTPSSGIKPTSYWVVLDQLLCINMQCRAMIWGGGKTCGGRTAYRRPHPPESLLDLSKRASRLLSLGFL